MSVDSFIMEKRLCVFVEKFYGEHIASLYLSRCSIGTGPRLRTPLGCAESLSVQHMIGAH